MPHCNSPKHLPRLACLLLLTLAVTPGWAQNKALDLARDKSVDLQPSLRDNLATIGRYAESVNRQAARLSGESSAAASAVAEAPNRRESLPTRRFDTMVDPFEVSPQLRDSRRPGAAFSGLPATSKLDVQRQIQVQAVLVTARGRGAQLLVRGQQSILVKDGELVDFGDLGIFSVHVGNADGVTLSSPGAPQGNKITLR